jgi:hypothetical protein
MRIDFTAPILGIGGVPIEIPAAASGGVPRILTLGEAVTSALFKASHDETAEEGLLDTAIAEKIITATGPVELSDAEIDRVQGEAMKYHSRIVLDRILRAIARR